MKEEGSFWVVGRLFRRAVGRQHLNKGEYTAGAEIRSQLCKEAEEECPRYPRQTAQQLSRSQVRTSQACLMTEKESEARVGGGQSGGDEVGEVGGIGDHTGSCMAVRATA